MCRSLAGVFVIMNRDHLDPSRNQGALWKGGSLLALKKKWSLSFSHCLPDSHVFTLPGTQRQWLYRRLGHNHCLRVTVYIKSEEREPGEVEIEWWFCIQSQLPVSRGERTHFLNSAGVRRWPSPTLVALHNQTKPFHCWWQEALEVPLTQEQNLNLKGAVVSLFPS